MHDDCMCFRSAEDHLQASLKVDPILNQAAAVAAASTDAANAVASTVICALYAYVPRQCLNPTAMPAQIAICCFAPAGSHGKGSAAVAPRDAAITSAKGPKLCVYPPYIDNLYSGL